eukprot:2923883-Prymnesium_polylepis.1
MRVSHLPCAIQVAARPRCSLTALIAASAAEARAGGRRRGGEHRAEHRRRPPRRLSGAARPHR